MILKKAEIVSCVLCLCLSAVLSGCTGKRELFNNAAKTGTVQDVSDNGDSTPESVETLNPEDEEISSSTSDAEGESEAEKTNTEATQVLTPTLTENPVSAESPISEEELLSRYDDVLSLYRELIAEEFDPARVNFNYFADINGRLLDLYRGQNPGLYYTFKDLSHDGNPELVLAVRPENSEHYELLAIYGRDNNEINRINESNNYGGEDGHFRLLSDGSISEVSETGGGMFPQAKVYRIKPDSCEKEVIVEAKSGRDGAFIMHEGETELQPASQEECKALVEEIGNLPELDVSDWKRLETTETDIPGPERISYAELREMMNWNEQDLLDHYGDCYWLQELGDRRYLAREMYIEDTLFSVEWWTNGSEMVSIVCETFDPALNAERMINAISETEGYEYNIGEEDNYTWFESDIAIVFRMHDEPAKLSLTLGG